MINIENRLLSLYIHLVYQDTFEIVDFFFLLIPMKIKIKNKKKVRIHIDRLKDSASKNTEDDRVP